MLEIMYIILDKIVWFVGSTKYSLQVHQIYKFVMCVIKNAHTKQV